MSARYNTYGHGQPASAPPAPGTAAPVHPDDLKLQRMQHEVGEVSQVMRDNMNRIMERDGNINDLVNRSETLQDTAVQYGRTAARVQRKMWWQNTKMKIILGVVVAVILVIIIVAILAGAGVFK